MAGLTNRQRVKVNAALSLIYAEGYDAQTVHNWASEYKGQGYPPAKAFERALNEFVAGQPEVGAAIGKITRLIHASDDATVAKYDQALNEYIATGNDAAISALGPMMAQDSVALSVRSGELADGTMSAEAVGDCVGLHSRRWLGKRSDGGEHQSALSARLPGEARERGGIERRGRDQRAVPGLAICRHGLSDQAR